MFPGIVEFPWLVVSGREFIANPKSYVKAVAISRSNPGSSVLSLLVSKRGVRWSTYIGCPAKGYGLTKASGA